MSDASVQPDPSDPFFANPVFGTDNIHQPGPVIPATAKEFPEPEVTLDDPEYGHHSPARRAIRDAKRVVVKIGSSSLTDESGHVSPERIDLIADALEARMDRGTDIIVVSSGSIACGMRPLGLSQRPTDLATKQAAAAAGQVLLAQEWARSFARYGRPIGQVLLTVSDAANRDRARNSQRTIDRLRQLGVIPIINENDTVTTASATFGDNDRLAALVSHLSYADACVLLSDVAGLYDRNPAEPDARFIAEVRNGGDLRGVVAGDGGRLGTGGMGAKVSAARLASQGGIPVLLTSTENIGAALDQAMIGTCFWPREDRLSAWKFWVLYTAESAGVLHIDGGAAQAMEHHNSLLAVGVTKVVGDFTSRQVVDIVGPGGYLIGRGEVNYDSATLQGMIGRSTAELPDFAQRPVVHVDNLSTYANRLSRAYGATR
ncbi:glutamate 5-kinase [Corynebacterium terpenotabidum]|uniref:Glutamate 5-kinase n=1 Tax=Corynebacterium terpenotabidum Y-11 TaxID=1200352 RepID=S4XCW4_9CORY|nr:glutamate 5-kinase [Corynebacterium terpenotabidum]AGP30374.1 gamma-glutamyl kinase [Corynebacterium terpenotabidum Y-11]